MFNPLTPADFPLYSIGNLVYRQTQSSPFFAAPSMELAADLAFRLNAHESTKSSITRPPYQWVQNPGQMTPLTIQFGEK